MKHVTLILIALLVGGLAVAYEEPDYEVIAERDGYEVRAYAPYIIAEVDVTGDFGEAGNKAFRILAGYIFGDNQPQKKMKMTVPVESRERDGETYTYAFVMESRYSMDTLPQPNNENIRIRERPARLMAVNRYSGSNGEKRYDREKQELLSLLERDDVRAIGKPVFARYNGPFTLPFLRRNEVLVEIDAP